MARGFEQHVAQLCGVTPAGLRYLASMVATGDASQRGNEATKLLNDGLLEPNLHDGYRPWFKLTDAGRAVVLRARSMGW
jgi:hypothetical protein